MTKVHVCLITFKCKFIETWSIWKYNGLIQGKDRVTYKYENFWHGLRTKWQTIVQRVLINVGVQCYWNWKPGLFVKVAEKGMDLSRFRLSTLSSLADLETTEYVHDVDARSRKWPENAVALWVRLEHSCIRALGNIKPYTHRSGGSLSLSKHTNELCSTSKDNNLSRNNVSSRERPTRCNGQWFKRLRRLSVVIVE